MEDEHLSSHGKNPKANKGKPFKENDHPTQNAHSNHGQGANKGKPLKGEDHPSSQGKNHKKEPGKPDKGSDHPSSHAQGNQGHSKDKGKPLWGDESIANHAKQEDVIEHSFSSPEEKIQIANAAPVQGKGNAKGLGKGKKVSRGKHKQQTGTAAAVTHQEPAPRIVPLKTTPASFEPLVFGNDQRIAIQSYYKNSSSKKSNKGRGKQNKRPKRHQTSSVAKNDILTQPSQPLPQSLESQLPPPPPNTKRVLYNQQVLLVEGGTNRVLDVININN